MVATLAVGAVGLSATPSAGAQSAVVTVPITQGGTVAIAAGKTGKPDKPCPNAGRPAAPSELGPSVPDGQLAAGLQEGTAPGHCRFDYTAVLDVHLPTPPAHSTLESARLRVALSDVRASTKLAVFATKTSAPQGTLLAEVAPSVDSPATAASVEAPGEVALDALPAVEALLRGDASSLGVAGLPSRALFAAPGTPGAPTLELTYVADQPADTTAPTVAITSPKFGESVYGEVTVDVDASDDTGVAAVTVTLGGRLVATDERPPFSVVVDTTGLPNGEQPLAVEAIDAAGNTARALIPVVVDNTGGPLRRLDLDYQAGRINVDTYVLQALYAVLGQPELDPKYAGALPEEVSSWTWTVLQLRSHMSQDARARLDEMLTAVDEVPAQPAAPLVRTTGTRIAAQTSATLASTAVASTAVASTAVASTALADPDYCSRLRSLLHRGYDCAGLVGKVTLYWDSEDYSEPKGDVPAKVAEAARGLENAQSYFDARGWQPIGDVDAYMAKGLIEERAISLPYFKEVLLNRDDPDLAATAGHELFHQYEYQYLNALDVLDPRKTTQVQDIAWALEATAEWASHQLVAEYPGDYSDLDKTEYYRNIELFLQEPQRDLLAWDSSTNRQYGAFAVIEWLEATHGADSVRALWESIDDSGKARQAIANAIGPIGDLMWRDLYMLDLDIPGRVDRAETDKWRAQLPDTVGLAPYASVSGRRPVETSLSLGNGDSTNVPVSLGAGGATFIEVDVHLDQRAMIRLSPAMDKGSVTVGALPLVDYDLDPTTGPETCANPQPDGDDWVVEYDPDACAGLSVVVSNPSLNDDATGSLGIEVGDRVDTTMSNGLIRMGVHAEGHLNVPGYDASSGTGTTTVGLRWMPTNADALAPGCVCEGWGIADVGAGVGGWANASWGGTQDLTLQRAAFDTTSGISEVGAGAGSPFLVTHKFSIAQETANLFQVDVTITNNTTSLGELLGLYTYGPLTPTYRRVMDWDVEPTAFSEYVTIGAKGGQLPPEVVNATNDGFASPDPRHPATDLGARGLFEDFGPADHGALFDVRLPEIDPGESVTFTMFYGAGATEAMAKDALRLVNADAWSLAEPDVSSGATSGEPNTFAFGLRFNRPIPALARGLAAGTVREVEPARNDGLVRQ